MHKHDSRVAVVIITRNRRGELLRSLNQLGQFAERPQIVVVDQGCTDGTAAAVAAAFPEVRLVEAGRNLGAAGRSLGVQHVDAPYVAFCDDDTWYEPGALRHAADLFDAYPRLAVITGSVLVGSDERLDPTCEAMAHSPLPRSPHLPGPQMLGFLAGASVVRRSAFLEVGGFQERFFIGGEEELLATDLTVRGWWLCYVPDVVVHHHPSPHRDGATRRGHMLRNALWFAWLRRPWPSALRRTWRLVRQQPLDAVTLRGGAAALAGLPWVLRQRRVVPAEVEQGLCLLEATHTNV